MENTVSQNVLESSDNIENLWKTVETASEDQSVVFDLSSPSVSRLELQSLNIILRPHEVTTSHLWGAESYKRGNIWVSGVAWRLSAPLGEGSS